MCQIKVPVFGAPAPEAVVNDHAPSQDNGDASDDSGSRSPKPVRPKKNGVADTDTFIMSFTGSQLACGAIIKGISMGAVTHILPEETVLVSSKTSMNLFSNLNNVDEGQYVVNDDLVTPTGIKVRFASKKHYSKFTPHIRQEINKPQDNGLFTAYVYGYKNDGTTVTKEDIENRTCWLYLTAGVKRDSLPLTLMAPNKKQFKVYYGYTPLAPLMAFTSTLKLNEDGVAVKRTDCPGYIEVVFPTESRFRSFYLHAKEAPRLDCLCYSRVVDNTAYVAYQPCKGIYNVTLGITKKYVDLKKQAAADDDDDDEDHYDPPLESIVSSLSPLNESEQDAAAEEEIKKPKRQQKKKTQTKKNNQDEAMVTDETSPNPPAKTKSKTTKPPLKGTVSQLAKSFISDEAMEVDAAEAMAEAEEDGEYESDFINDEEEDSCSSTEENDKVPAILPLHNKKKKVRALSDSSSDEDTDGPSVKPKAKRLCKPAKPAGHRW